MIEFKPVPVSETLPEEVRDTFIAVQSAIKLGFQEIPDSSEPDTNQVNGGQFNVTSEMSWVLVDSRGGDVTIVLPLPRVSQELKVIKEYATTWKVLVKTKDGNSSGNLSPVTTVDYGVGKSLSLVCDGSKWWAS